MKDRPVRDGGWLRDTYKYLKGRISLIFINRHDSGNQDAENEYDEWYKFACRFNEEIMIYAIAVIPGPLMDQLGRALPLEAQKDTGAYDTNQYGVFKSLYSPPTGRKKRDLSTMSSESSSPEVTTTAKKPFVKKESDIKERFLELHSKRLEHQVNLQTAQVYLLSGDEELIKKGREFLKNNYKLG